MELAKVASIKFQFAVAEIEKKRLARVDPTIFQFAVVCIITLHKQLQI